MTKLVILLSGEARSGKDTSADILKSKLEESGSYVVKTYFAKRLKESLKHVFNLTDEHVFGALKEIPFGLTLDYHAIYELVLEELHHGNLMSVDVHMNKYLHQDIMTTASDITTCMVFAIRHNAEFNEKDGTFMVSPRQLMQWWGTEAVRQGAYQDAWVDCVQFDLGYENAEIGIISDARFDNEVIKIREYFPDAKVVAVEVTRGDKVKVSKHISEVGISESLVDFHISNDDTIPALSLKLSELLKLL